jgi:hypothetical protein
MLKTGIYSVDQLNDPKNFKTIFGNDKKFSITLYPEIVNDPKKSDLAEQILLNFTDDRGAFKRTYANRFEEFDAAVLKEIQSRFSSHDPLIFHDAAISDGRTACDFFEKLEPHFPSLEYYASDYDPYIYVIEEGRTKIVVNRDNKALEVIFPPFVFNCMREPRRYPLNQFIKYVLNKTFVRSILMKCQNDSTKSKEYTLFSPKTLRMSDQNPKFHLIRHNLLDSSPIPQPITIFRAMNILNAGYFSSNEFKILIRHIFNSLSDNGLFITGSNQDSNTTVHGGVFQKNKGKLQKIWQSGNGSTVEDIILSLTLP